MEVAAFVLIVLAFVTSSVYVIAQPRMLGHDESVYALMARSWLADTPDTGVSSHRAPLLPAVGVAVLALDVPETALRMIGVASGVGLILAVWWVTRRIGGGLAGLGAAAVVATSPTVLDEARSYLTDVPAAALLIAMTGLIWWQLGERDAPDRRLLLVAPLAWAAYELRYGSALVVLIVFSTAAALCWSSIYRRWRLVVSTVGLLALLLVPHLVNSTLELGSPWARVLYTSEVAGRDYIGQGLVEYVRWFPSELAGLPAAVLMGIGIVGTAVAWLRGEPARRALGFLVIPAAVHVVAIGLASHGEPRFVLFSIGLWCAAGAVFVTRMVTALAARTSAGAWALLTVAAIMLAVWLGLVVRQDARSRDRLASQEAPFLAALETLAAEGGPDCSVLTSYGPQATWYTACEAYHFGHPPVEGIESRLTADAWMLLRENGKRQPDGALLDYYESLAEAPPREWTAGGAPWARLYELGTTSTSEGS